MVNPLLSGLLRLAPVTRNVYVPAATSLVIAAERDDCGLLLAMTVPAVSASVAVIPTFAQSPTGVTAKATRPPLVVNWKASVSPVVSITPSADAVLPVKSSRCREVARRLPVSSARYRPAVCSCQRCHPFSRNPPQTSARSRQAKQRHACVIPSRCSDAIGSPTKRFAFSMVPNKA